MTHPFELPIPYAQPRMIYITGIPGSGKTTAVNGALAELGWDRRPVAGSVPHEQLIWPSEPPVVWGAHLGRPRVGFGGTDTLSLSIQPKALAWLSAVPYALVLGEGDRLANAGFLDGAAAAGYAVTLVLLDTPEPAAAARRDSRGSAQNPSWIRGRVTKVASLAAARQHVRLDGLQSPQAVADALADLLGG